MFKNLKRAISTGGGASHAGSFEADVRSASAPTGNLDSVFGNDHQEEIPDEDCDPLMYRLRHQKQYIQEKQQFDNSGRSGSLRRSLSERSRRGGRDGAQRDPFDLSGSLTSEDTSRHKSEDDKSKESDVDVVGWGARNSGQRRRRGSQRSSDSSNLSDCDEDEGNDALLVDFGGVTPNANIRRRRTVGAADAAELLESFSSPRGREEFPSSRSQDGLPHYRYRPQRNKIKSGRDGDEGMNDGSNPPDGHDEEGKAFDGPSSSPSHADLANILRTLERESMKMEGVPPGPQSPRTRPPYRESGVSTLSSPVERSFLELSVPSPRSPSANDDRRGSAPSPPASPSMESSLPENDHRPDAHRRQQPAPPPRPQSPLAHIEECPRLAQLKQQNTSDLRSELSKMQFQSKTNLENSWSETERMRVENSALDVQLEKVRKELAIARAVLLTGGRRPTARRPSLGGRSDAGGSQFVRTKSGESFKAPPLQQQPKRKFRRRRTIDGAADAFSDAASLCGDVGMCGGGGGWMRNSVRRVDSAKSLVDLSGLEDELELARNEFQPAQVQKRPDVGNSFGNRRRLSSSAAGALEDSATNHAEQSSDQSSSMPSSGPKRRPSGFLGNLGNSLRNLKASSGCSVSSSDFDLGLEMDDDISESSSSCGMSKEFDDKVFNALLSAPSSSIPHSSEGDRDPLHVTTLKTTSSGAVGKFYSDYDNASTASSDAKSGVFYPSPMMEDEGGRDDSSSDAISGAFYPPPLKDEEEECIDSRRTPLAGDASSIAGHSLSEVMDDFDFDPFGDSAKTDHRERVASPKPVNRRKKDMNIRGSFVRRPSFMSLFDDKDLDLDDDTDDDEAIVTSARTPPPEKKKKQVRVAIIQASTLEKNHQLERMNETVRKQEDDIKACDDDIARATLDYDDFERQFKREELALQLEVDELQEKASQDESKLVCLEEAEHQAKEREMTLAGELEEIKRNGNNFDIDDDINGDLLEGGFDHSIDLEERLSSCKLQYESSQENAIQSLSALLDEIDAMHIPSENDESISGDIVAHFDRLTDKEEGLVRILSDPSRLASCQASFEHIQTNIEAIFGLKHQLEVLESDLQRSLATIKMLIRREGDEGTHTTESSTASERLSSERVFIEAIITQVEGIKLNQGRALLDALSSSVEFLTRWDQLLLPDSSVPLTSSLSFSSGGKLDAITDAILEAKGELAAVTWSIIDEQSRFDVKMQGAGISSRPSPKGNASFNGCNHINNATPNAMAPNRLGLLAESKSHSKPPHAREGHSEANHSQSSLNEILGDGADGGTERLLQDLDQQIHAATSTLSERESLMHDCSSEFISMQAQAEETARTRRQSSNEMHAEIKRALARLDEVDSFEHRYDTVI